MNEPHRRTTWFLERSLGSRLVLRALIDAGEVVESHSEHFAQDAADVDWIPVVALKGWVVLAKDLRIRWRPLEKAAVLQSGARMFVFASGNTSGKDMADAFVQALPHLDRFLDEHTGPFIAKVYRDGSVRMWQDWSAELDSENG